MNTRIAKKILKKSNSIFSSFLAQRALKVYLRAVKRGNIYGEIKWGGSNKSPVHVPVDFFKDI